jgi:hypothetical protein
MNRQRSIIEGWQRLHVFSETNWHWCTTCHLFLEDEETGLEIPWNRKGGYEVYSVTGLDYHPTSRIAVCTCPSKIQELFSRSCWWWWVFRKKSTIISSRLFRNRFRNESLMGDCSEIEERKIPVSSTIRSNGLRRRQTYESMKGIFYRSNGPHRFRFEDLMSDSQSTSISIDRSVDSQEISLWINRRSEKSIFIRLSAIYDFTLPDFIHPIVRLRQDRRSSAHKRLAPKRCW